MLDIARRDALALLPDFQLSEMTDLAPGDWSGRPQSEDDLVMGVAIFWFPELFGFQLLRT